jgi:hypothetical protein
MYSRLCIGRARDGIRGWEAELCGFFTNVDWIFPTAANKNTSNNIQLRIFMYFSS